MDDIGGSLLNDLLLDLNNFNNANAAQSNNNDHADDLFALLSQVNNQESSAPTTTTAPPLPPPGMMQVNPAALVVNQQANYNTTSISSAPVPPPSKSSNDNDDLWSNALSQPFGNMSLAADFLAADSANKQQKKEVEDVVSSNNNTPLNSAPPLLFEEDYNMDGEIKLGEVEINKFGGVSLGAMVKEPQVSSKSTPSVVPPPHQEANKASSLPTKVTSNNINPPPGSMLPPPHMMNMNNVPPGNMLPPPPHHMSMMPPQMMYPMPPQMMVPPPMQQPPLLVARPPVLQQPPASQFNNEDFPELGAEPPQPRPKSSPEQQLPTTLTNMGNITSEAQLIFNNANYGVPPIAAHLASAKLMPFRDICFIVNMMLRPLKSLDTYNDDYYHWSVVNSKTFGPAPVQKGIKEIAKEGEEIFHQSIQARAKKFADEKKSLGQLVKRDVKRPQALLNTPVLKKEDDRDEENTRDVRQSSRINLWKARLSIDRGYTAFLSLIELRRLIQSNVGATGLINALMVDVKTNVDLLHSSLGVKIQVDSKGAKSTEIDEPRLTSALSLPKGRVLCARVMETGILPHPSACKILPVALRCILSWPAPVDGEDRLINALTSLILTVNPPVDPPVLCHCLDMSIVVLKDTGNDKTAITSNHMRMKLLHAILSTGKNVCSNSPMKEEWSEKELVFVEVLSGSQ